MKNRKETQKKIMNKQPKSYVDKCEQITVAARQTAYAIIDNE